MHEQHATLVNTRTVYQGKVFQANTDQVRLPNGKESTMDVLRHPPSVVLVPMPDPNHVVLVRQYRYCINQWIWELPAGPVEPGEGLEAAAVRECQEEIGQVPKTIEKLTELYPTPGYCDELMVFFRLQGLSRPSNVLFHDEDEILESHLFTVKDAHSLLDQTNPKDMKTVIGLGYCTTSWT